MFIKPVMLAVALLSVSVMAPVMAQTPAVAISQAQAASIAQSLAVAETPAERRPIIEAALGTNPGAAVEIVEQLKLICVDGSEVCDRAKASAILQEILAFLGLKKENEAIIDQLLAANADLLALGNSDVEPAAGPGGTGGPDDLGSTTTGGDTGPGDVVENPSQISGNEQ